jgi:hypothetical protein
MTGTNFCFILQHFLLNATQSLFLCDSSSQSKLNHHQTGQQGSPNHGISDKNGRTNGSAGGAGKVNNHYINSASTSPSRPPRGGGSNRTSPAKTSKVTKGSSSVPSSPLLTQNQGLIHHHSLSGESKSSIRSFVFIQGWQLLSLAVSLFLPKNNKLLWYLKQHLLRNVDIK